MGKQGGALTPAVSRERERGKAGIFSLYSSVFCFASCFAGFVFGFEGDQSRVREHTVVSCAHALVVELCDWQDRVLAHTALMG